MHNELSDKKLNSDFVLDRNIELYIEDMNYVYKAVSDILDKKTKDGVNKIVKEAGSFNTNDGLTFKKINKNNDSLSYDVVSRGNFKGFTKILLKDFNNKIKKGYLIKNNQLIVKNFDAKFPDRLPQNPEYYSAEEASKLNLEKDLFSMLETIDKQMLKARRFVEQRKDCDLKPPAAFLSSELQTSLKNLTSMIDETDKVCANIPPASLTRNKIEFGDYVVQYGHSSYKFKNIGKENLQIVFTEFNNLYEGNFSRLMVYNSDGSVKTGYLFKDKKIVSNFNPNYQSTLPDKLDFVDVEKMKNEHYNEELQIYLSGYKDKLISYKNFLTEKRNTPQNALPKESLANVQAVDSLYYEVEKMLSQMSNRTANQVKNEYPDYDIEAGKKGYTFKNVGPDKKTINIFKSKSASSDEIITIAVLDKNYDKAITLGIKNNEKYISNYKIPEKVMHQKLKLLNYLPSLKTKLTEFRSLCVNQNDIAEAKKAETKLRKIKHEKTTGVKKGRPLSPLYQENPWLKEKEYNDLINAAIKDFKDCMKNMKGSLEKFDEETAKIRKKLEAFIENKKGTEN